MAGTVQAGQAGAACNVDAPALPQAEGRLEIPVRVTSNAAPLTVGVEASGHGDRTYLVTLFKLFLSQPELLDAQGTAVSAQFLAADGKPAPYGLALVDADDPLTQTLRLAAPAGSYTALRLGVGVPAACNHVTSANQTFPLNPDSDMFWTWGSQFLFIRLEGRYRAAMGMDWDQFVYHLGFDSAFTTLTLPGQISVGPEGIGPALLLDIDRLLATDSATLPPGQHTAPDELVLRNLVDQQPLYFE